MNNNAQQVVALSTDASASVIEAWMDRVDFAGIQDDEGSVQDLLDSAPAELLAQLEGMPRALKMYTHLQGVAGGMMLSATS